MIITCIFLERCLNKSQKCFANKFNWCHKLITWLIIHIKKNELSLLKYDPHTLIFFFTWMAFICFQIIINNDFDLRVYLIICIFILCLFFCYIIFKVLYRFWYVFYFIHIILTYSYICIVFILFFVLCHIFYHIFLFFSCNIIVSYPTLSRLTVSIIVQV